MNFACPHCENTVFGVRSKLLASLWGVVRCPQCGKPSCAQPLVLGGLYFLLVWDLLLFGYVAFVNFKTDYPSTGYIYLAVMTAGVAILGFFAAYVPLVRMRAED